MWRPIETAPRDGQPFKGRDVDGNLFICRWWTGQELADLADDGEATDWEHGFYEFVGENGEDGDLIDPTFWWDLLSWRQITRTALPNPPPLGEVAARSADGGGLTWQTTPTMQSARQSV
jgi:hypothetical protein